MMDWTNLLTFAIPIACVFLGAWLNWLVVNREKLITHYGHASTFRIEPDNKEFAPFVANTHSIVIKNIGKKTAKNVRLGHQIMPPNMSIYPDMEYSINTLPSGSKEILVPRIVPKKEITISYLYYEPLTYNKINTTVESDEGPALVVNALLQPLPPKWLVRLIWVLMVSGVIGIVYAAVQFAM